MTVGDPRRGAATVAVMADAVRFHFDMRCPWCYQTSRWVRRLAELGEVTVSWGVFALELQNFTKPIDRFDPARGHGIAALRTAVAVRDAVGQDACGAFYSAVGDRYFVGLEDLADPVTLRAGLADAGLDPDWCDRALADEGTWHTVLADHTELVTQTRSFGVPTIRLDDGAGPAIFGPVVSEPPTDDDAVELWRHVRWLARYENFHELKRERDDGPDLPYWHRFVEARRVERERS